MARIQVKQKMPRSVAKHGKDFYALHRPGVVERTGLTAIDLFSGAGGLSLGLENAGIDVRFACDFSSACGETHARNFPGIPFHLGDVETLSPKSVMNTARVKPGELDVLAGGPPCQGFSIIGERDRDDPRNRLFQHFLAVADALRPKAIVMENVTGLATMGRGTVLGEIGAAFDGIGYSVSCAELLAAQYGVPQMRWRMVFVGWRRDGYAHLHNLGFPVPTHGQNNIGDLLPNRTITRLESESFLTAFDAIGDLPPVLPGELNPVYSGKPETPYQKAMRSGMSGKKLFNHYAPNVSALNLARIASLKPGQDWRDMPHELLPAGMRRALRKDHTRRYRRMKWDGVPRSIITKFRDPKSGEYSHPEQNRTISIREAARVQSFPDWLEFCGTNSDQYEQVGNAVPPLLGRAVGREIVAVLNGERIGTNPPRSRYRIPVAADPTLFPFEVREIVA